MADRTIPEDDQPQMLKPKSYGQRANSVKNQALFRRVQARVNQSKNGTPHEQHLAHLQHMQNVKNNPRKYG